jgi:hypothetical protein
MALSMSRTVDCSHRAIAMLSEQVRSAVRQLASQINDVAGTTGGTPSRHSRQTHPHRVSFLYFSWCGMMESCLSRGVSFEQESRKLGITGIR